MVVRVVGCAVSATTWPARCVPARDARDARDGVGVTGGGLLPVGLVSVIVFGAMLWELRVSRANEREYRRRGAVEGPDPVYRLMRVAYPGAFLLMAIEGVWRSPLAGWPLPAGAVLFVVAKLLKVWAIRALGHRWTYKVLVLPHEPLVTAGPYAFV